MIVTLFFWFFVNQGCLSAGEFLSFTCASCEGKFCSEHRTVQAHKCAAGLAALRGTVALVCARCSATVAVKEGEDAEASERFRASVGAAPLCTEARVKEASLWTVRLIGFHIRIRSTFAAMAHSPSKDVAMVDLEGSEVMPTPGIKTLDNGAWSVPDAEVFLDGAARTAFDWTKKEMVFCEAELHRW